MNYKRLSKTFCRISLALLWICSCTAEPCEYSDGVKVNFGFYHYEGNSLQDTLIDSLQVYLINNSLTPYYDGSKKKVDGISLPLSMIVDTSSFIFQFDSLSSDTLTFRYSQYLQLVSHECGFVNFYNILSYETTNNRIDSIWIRKDLVEYGDEENIKIYF